jgi:hypothetical protein
MADHPVVREARELTPKELDARRKRAYQVDESLRGAIAQGRKALWATAVAATAMADMQGFRDLNYESLNEYLGDPEIGISRSHFMRMVRIVRFASDRQIVERIQNLELTKIDVVIPAIRDGYDREEALHDVETLSKRDLIDKYIGSKADNNGEADAGSSGETGDTPTGEVDNVGRPTFNDSAPVVASDVAVEGYQDHPATADVPDGDTDTAETPQETPGEHVTGEVVGEGGAALGDRPGAALFAGTRDAETLEEDAELDGDERERRRNQASWDWADHVAGAKFLRELLIDALASEAAMPRVNARHVAGYVPNLEALIEFVESTYAE